jgi:hypothetical protein
MITSPPGWCGTANLEHRGHLEDELCGIRAQDFSLDPEPIRLWPA